MTKKSPASSLMFSTALGAGLFAAWLGMAGMAAAGPAPVQQFGVNLPSPGGIITVRPGDTLYKLAALYRVAAEDLAAMNDLRPPYALSVGRRLLLPLPREHRVRKDDTLYSLARMYGVTVDALAGENRVNPPYTLKQGQVLRIPSAAPQSVKAAPPGPAARKQAASPPVRHARGEVPMLKKPGQGVFDGLLDRLAKDDAPEKPQASLVSAATAAAPAGKAVVVGQSGRAGFIWPVRGQVISSYGPKDGGLYNDGINIAAPRGTPVKSAADGTVAYVGDKLSSYGNLVLIRHADGMVTAYAHLHTVAVKAGDRVARGQVIGSVGSTGTVMNAQLHFEVRQGKKTFDPKQYLG